MSTDKTAGKYRVTLYEDVELSNVNGSKSKEQLNDSQNTADYTDI